MRNLDLPDQSWSADPEPAINAGNDDNQNRSFHYGGK
jgi:hypothetical protein